MHGSRTTAPQPRRGSRETPKKTPKKPVDISSRVLHSGATMIAHRTVVYVAAAGLAALAMAAENVPEAVPREAAAARAELDAGLRASDDEAQRLMQGLDLVYADKLRQLQYTLQFSGRLRDLMAVHDEARRYQEKRTPPSATASIEPTELRVLAEEHLRVLRTAQYSNDMAVVRTASAYVQNLAILRRSLAEQADPEVLLALDAERDRLMTNARIRRAVAGSATTPGSLTNLTVATIDAGAPSGTSDRMLRIYGAGTDHAAVVMGYTLDVGMTEDASRLRERRTESFKIQSRSRDGAVGYHFRVTVAGRNSEVPPGSRIIIEYFSRSMTDNSKKFHSSEQAVLTGVGRGESSTVEFKGISLYRSESITAGARGGGTRSFSGDEFHGLIVSLLDPEGRIILQRFNPQAMIKEVTDTPGVR